MTPASFGSTRRRSESGLGSPRAEKHRLLDEVVAVTGIQRKAAIRLLRCVLPNALYIRCTPGSQRRGTTTPLLS